MSLKLDGNQLEIIPCEIGDFKRLRILHIHENRFSTIPASIFGIDGLSGKNGSSDLLLGEDKMPSFGLEWV